MESSWNLLLKAVFGLVLLAVFGHGANGQTNSTLSDLGNTTLTSNSTGAPDSGTNTTAVFSFSNQTYPGDNAIPEDGEHADWDDMQIFNDTDLTASESNVSSSDDASSFNETTSANNNLTSSAGNDMQIFNDTDLSASEGNVSSSDDALSFNETTSADNLTSSAGEDMQIFNDTDLWASEGNVSSSDDASSFNETTSANNLTSSAGEDMQIFNDTDLSASEGNVSSSDGLSSLNETTSTDNLTSSAANVTGNETSPGAEGEDWGMNVTQPSPGNNSVHSMSVDSPTQDSPEENTTMEDFGYENTTSEESPADGTPTDDYPTENATSHATPSGYTTSNENTTTDDDIYAEEDNTTTPSSSDLEFVPGMAANDTADTVDEDLGEDASNATLDDATEVSADDKTNATATNDTDTTHFVDDSGDGLEWEDDRDFPAYNDTIPEPDNVTDTSFNATSFNDTRPADNVTIGGESDAANVTSSDGGSLDEPGNSEKHYYFEDDSDIEHNDDDEDGGMTSANDTNVGSDTMTSDDSGDVNSTNDTSTSSNDTSAGDSATPGGSSGSHNGTEEEKADFVVYDSNGSPCLLASLNITIHFKYTVQEGLVREMYETVSKKNTQDGSSYQGSCEDQQSSLSITWNNNTFTLNLTFSLKDKDEASENEIDMDVLPPGTNSSVRTWSLQQVSLSYDTTNDVMFPGAYNPTVKEVRVGELSLFQTPLGMAYMCQTPEVVTVEFKDVDLAFNFLHLMPFGGTSQYFSGETEVCSGDLSSFTAKESYTIPLVVASVLASIVITIIIVYATVRCVTRRMRQADYKQME